MQHALFKPKNFEDSKQAVVGDCNGFTMQQRWDVETPLFAQAILNAAGAEPFILDYGCGCGRLAKEILKLKDIAYVVGTDASAQMMLEAEKYVDNKGFKTCAPEDLVETYDKGDFDLIYCVYVLQHVPAVEIRTILERIHHLLKDDGFFIYCSSDYRMAIRFDQPGFFDDRFLGVSLQEEISRYFEPVSPLFTKETLEANPLLNKMIAGADNGLAHPAFVFKPKQVNYLSATPSLGKPANKAGKALPAQNKATSTPEAKLLLINRLAPGDCLVMTNALRDLHKAYPGRYITDVRTPCAEVFQNNPYIQKLEYPEEEYNKLNKEFSKLSGINAKDAHLGKIGDILVVDMHYPLIHASGRLGSHFSEGHRAWLEDVLDVKIPQTDMRPEIYLTQAEKDWPSPALVKADCHEKYWVINAGSKDDFTLKQYPYYQEVVDILDEITFVQIGQGGHNHAPLHNVVDMRNKTSLRELFRLIYHAQGVVTCVSLPMHVAAAFNKPCVVVAGARESMRWEAYQTHQFLYVNGCLPCEQTGNGCWRSKVDDCNNKKEGVPLCMKLITPQDVAHALRRYYLGGVLEAKAEVKLCI